MLTLFTRCLATISVLPAFLVPLASIVAQSDKNEHLDMGNPSGAAADVGKPDNYLIKKRQYALSYNSSRGIPNWVSWHLSKKWLGKTRRTNAFAPDTTLPAGLLQVRPNDYRATGFDRGHMCPSGDRSVSREDQDATVLMTNMVPQAPNLNRVTWEKLEAYLRGQARDGQELYIVSGPSGTGGTGEKGDRSFLRSGRGRVVVPAKCWKVVLILPEGVTDSRKVTTAARMFGVIMPNSQTIDPAWRTYAVAVKDVEALTGYTFFSKLPADVAKELKADKDTRARPERVVGKGKEPEKRLIAKEKPKHKVVEGELAAFKEGCVIGNRRSKKYHLPSSRNYTMMKTSKNAVFFASAGDAKKAGYVQAGGKK